MEKSQLKITSLKNALASLERALAQPETEYTRDASIQRFEYTFELAWKLLRRYLTLEAGKEESILKNIFRTAAREGLIDNLDAWFSYLQGRNLTTHTYHEETAEETYQLAKAFAQDASLLIKKLEKNLG